MTVKKEDLNPIELFIPEMRLARSSPRFQIIVAHGILEMLVNTLIELCCKNGKKIIADGKSFPHATKLILLHEKEIITDEHFKLLENFRKLRNKAAHGFFEVNEEMLQPFKYLFKKNKIQGYANIPHFYSICLIVVVGFWNANIKHFRPYFEPELQSEMDKDKLIHDSLRK
jgi:uncharacterized protein YutE (UPF0331/DUF86 family)